MGAPEGLGQPAPAGDTELGVGVLEVVAYCTHRQEQAFGDVLAGHALDGEHHDLAFAPGQRVRHGGVE
jgi:hypothetical protein